MQSKNLLGAKISIMTAVGARYEGILREVDAAKKSMVLINVKSFGTEGRRNGVNEIEVKEEEIPEI